MIIDSSALLAILYQEPEAERIASTIASAETQPTIAAPNYLETAMILQSRLGDDGHDRSIV